MKKVIFTMILAVLGFQAWAGHFSVTKTSSSQAVDGATKTMKEEIDTDLNTYKLVSLNEKYNYAGLAKTKMNEYISETGQVHLMSELLIKYENLLQDIKETTFELSGTQDLDVFYVLSKKGNSYTIDIYTGADAHKMNSTQNTK